MWRLVGHYKCLICLFGEPTQDQVPVLDSGEVLLIGFGTMTVLAKQFEIVCFIGSEIGSCDSMIDISIFGTGCFTSGT